MALMTPEVHVVQEIVSAEAGEVAALQSAITPTESIVDKRWILVEGIWGSSQ